jgi:hypothetical protein
LNQGAVQAAEDGGAIAYLTTGPTSGEAPAEGNTELTSPVLSVRESGGWGSRDITTGDASTVGKLLGFGTEYRLFSSDLSLSLVEQLAYLEEPPLLAPDASERTEYLRDDAPVVPGPAEVADYAQAQSNGEASAARGEVFGEPGYLPLLTVADTRPGAKFGGVSFGGPCVSAEAEPLRCISRYQANNVEGATGDLSHVVLRSMAGLTASEGSTPAAEARGIEGSLYEYSGGRLQLVSVLPNGKQAGIPPPRTTLEASEEAGDGPVLGGPGSDGPTVVRHAISNNGSRIIWTDTTSDPQSFEAERSTALYMRDVSTGQTVRLDTAQGEGLTQPPVSNAVFQTANADSSRVFFTDTQKLTPNSRATEGSAERGEADLYVCEMHAEAGNLACALHDLTVPLNPGEHAAVQADFVGANSGVVLGATEEEASEVERGANVYFVAKGVLSGANEEGRAPVSGEYNLYVDHYNGSGWEPRFIVVLSGEDAPDWAPKAQMGRLEQVTARVSPNGEYLAFMSDLRLTGYDNVDTNSPAGEPHLDEEVFEYNAATGRLACASCNPTAERRPAGKLDQALSLVDKAGVWEGRWLAGSVPGWDALTSRRSVYQSRYLDNAGRLFFDSPDALVPGASNATDDVYEFEPEGVGSEAARCEPTVDDGLDVFKPEHPFAAEGGSGEPVTGVEPAGCVGLMSSGVASEESAFVDASASGADVFFVTSEQLVSQDTDGNYDMYDAHECSVEVPCFPESASVAPACASSESCRTAGPTASSVFGAPATQTFSGAANPPSASGLKLKTAADVKAADLAKALKVCRAKHNKRKRMTCEGDAHKRYGPPHKAKKGSTRKSGDQAGGL